MKYLSTAFVVSLAAGALAQNISINTPSNVVQCTNIQLNWNGGTRNAVHFGSFQNGNANGAILETIPNVAGPNTYTWNTNLQGPNQIGITIRDANGENGQTGPFEINASSDSSCLTTSGSSAPASTDSAATSAASGSSAPASATDSSAASAASSVASAVSSAASSAASSGSSAAHSGSSSGSSAPTSGTSSSSGATTSQTGTSSATSVAVTGFTGVISVLLAAFLA
ncbi:hypothetical protein EIP86_006368 [Pleurotus ostreatoroseus]|nr:hypothetical protein EIP86_006368 [Pleurotus ostreatoroseus]